MHDSILSHRGFRWLWVTTILLIAALAFYIWHDPTPRPNGGTWLGYTLGGIGAALIVWLMTLGIRKRSYKNRLGTLRGWASAHVYLGTSLILIATLHSGLQFGWNIHTLAYVLMMIVIVSGFFGVYAYLRYPSLMTSNRRGLSRQAILDEITELDEEALKLADKLGPKVHSLVVRSVERTRLGGGVWKQLRGGDASDSALEETRNALADMQSGKEKRSDTMKMQTMVAMVSIASGASSGEDAENMRRLMDVLARKKSMASRMSRDIQLQALMEIWLYLHVPLSFALLAALICHVVAVFFYW